MGVPVKNGQNIQIILRVNFQLQQKIFILCTIFAKTKDLSDQKSKTKEHHHRFWNTQTNLSTKF